MSGDAVIKKDFIVLGDDFPGYTVDMFNIPAHYEDTLKCVLIPKGFVLDRTEKLARNIFNTIDKTKPLLVLCVLKGGYQFFNDVMLCLRNLCGQSPVSVQMSIDFIRLKSYHNDQSSGDVKVIGGDDLTSVAGKNVLIVEDIIDTGRTMSKLLKLMENYKPHSVNVVSMLVKRTKRSCGYKPDFIGFEIPDDFVVGYGIDYNEYFRDVSHVCIINKAGIKKFAVKENL